MSTSSAQAHALHEPEDPGLVAANLNVGVRLLISGIVFVFVAFVFAFFYLKAVNSNGEWRPAHVDPSQGYGIAILVGVLGATVAFALARREVTAGAWGRWRAFVGVALAVSVAVVVVEVLQLTGTKFGVTGGGYASVFYGWNALSLALWLGALYWVETLFASSLRSPATTEPVGFQLAESLPDSARACVVFLASVSAIQLVTYILLYLIK